LATGFAFKKLRICYVAQKPNSSNPKFYSENGVFGKRGTGAGGGFPPWSWIRIAAIPAIVAKWAIFNTVAQIRNCRPDMLASAPRQRPAS
jgi:hypothetical protein